jgi:hypothetical protein
MDPQSTRIGLQRAGRRSRVPHRSLSEIDQLLDDGQRRYDHFRYKTQWGDEEELTKRMRIFLCVGDKYEAISSDDSYRVYMRLKIRSVGLADFGAYKCVAKNSLGETDGTIKLYEIPNPHTTFSITTTTTYRQTTTEPAIRHAKKKGHYCKIQIHSTGREIHCAIRHIITEYFSIVFCNYLERKRAKPNKGNNNNSPAIQNEVTDDNNHGNLFCSKIKT